MTELQRLRKVLIWLSLCGFGDDDTALSTSLNYKKSSFSQIVNGTVPLSDSFIKRLLKLDQNINIVWIREGKGAMLNSLDSLRQFYLIDSSQMLKTDSDNTNIPDINSDLNMESPGTLINLLKEMLKEKEDEIIELRLQNITYKKELERSGKLPGVINPGETEIQKNTG